MKYCFTCEKKYPDEESVCPIHGTTLVPLKEEPSLEPSIEPLGATGKVLNQTSRHSNITVVEGEIYERDVSYDKGLEISRTPDRMVFLSTGKGRVLTLFMWGLGTIFIICTILVYWGAGLSIKSLLTAGAGIALIFIAGYFTQFTIREYFIIDFDENLYVKAASNVGGKLSKALKGGFFKKLSILDHRRRGELRGIAVSYKVEGRVKSWSRMLEDKTDCEKVEETLLNKKVTTEVVLISLQKELIPITDQRIGKAHKEKAIITAQIISHLWKLPYYNSPPNHEINGFSHKAGKDYLAFKPISYKEMAAKPQYTEQETMLSWILFAFFLLVIFPIFIYYLAH